MPAMKAPRGVKRMRALFENWIGWPQRAQLPGGCPIDAATREYHHQPGPMRDAVIERQKTFNRELRKLVQMAVDSGELRADTDANQVVYDFFGIVLVYYRAELMIGADESARRARIAFDRLLQNNTP
jgi:hypothetical protein